MDKAEFITQLKRNLKKLPEDEIKNAIEYYEEYFNEAGEENEQKIIEELGNPANVASQIIANFAIKGTETLENSTSKGLSTLWMVILATFLSPVALPVAITIAALAISFIIVIFSVIFSFAVTGIALCIAGIFYSIISISLIAQDFATSIFFTGFGLLSFGTGLAFIILTTFLSTKSFGWITNRMSKFILRRNEK